MSWISRIVNSFRPSRLNDQLDEELQFHIQQRVEDLVREGLPRREAERVARRRLGNALQVRESSHDVKSAAWLESFFRDFRFGLRMLRKHLTASLAAILSLGLALGASTAAFALLDALVLRPLPLPEPHQLIDLAQVMPAFFSPDNRPRESGWFSYAEFELLRDTARDRADLFPARFSGGLQPAQFDDAGGASENVRAESIGGSGFPILGVKPALGRLILPDDEAASVAVLSYPFWKRHFGGSPSAIGRWVTLGANQYQIVGVTAAPFSGLQAGYLTDLWTPLPRDPAPDHANVAICGRLHPTADPVILQRELEAASINFTRELVQRNPPRNLHGAQLKQFIERPLRVRDASTGRTAFYRERLRQPLWILGLICGLLLLIACSNVANLLIARASARTAEMALRVSLGAARGRLIQQMLIESSQLAAAACILALVFAAFVAPYIAARLGPTELPAWLDVNPSLRTSGFAAGLAVLTSLLFGLVPAIRASAASPAAALKADTTAHAGRDGVLRIVLAAQVAFSVAVLFLSGLLLLSFRKLIDSDLGFTTHNVILFDLRPRGLDRPRPDTGAELLHRLRRLPGIQSVSASQQRPMGGDMAWIQTPIIRLPGRAVETVRPREVPVSAGFFQAMQLRWIAGRDFLPGEIAAKSSSVIVNQAFVDKFFPHQDPIGRRFDKLTDDPDPIPQQIIGIVGNARYNNLREPERPSVYAPLGDITRSTLNVRTASAAASLIPWLRKEIETAAPALTVSGNILLESQIANTLITERLLALLAGFFSVVALLLASVGLYGIVSYAAVRRTREIGIRIALGARPSTLARMLVADTSTAVVAGLAVGMVAGLVLARCVTSILFGVKPTDPGSLLIPVAAILLTALVAVLIPATRAAGSDPLAALRHD